MDAKRLLILKILSEKNNWMYGLDIIRESEGGIKRGSVYTFLADLEAQDLVRSREEPNPPAHLMPRPQYHITHSGRRIYQEQSAPKNTTLKPARA